MERLVGSESISIPAGRSKFNWCSIDSRGDGNAVSILLPALKSPCPFFRIVKFCNCFGGKVAPIILDTATSEIVDRFLQHSRLFPGAYFRGRIFSENVEIETGIIPGPVEVFDTLEFRVRKFFDSPRFRREVSDGSAGYSSSPVERLVGSESVSIPI